MKVLIVGCGTTGALCAYFIRNLGKPVSIDIWESGAYPGGRMKSMQYKNETFTADPGAQYVTTTQDLMTANNDVYDLLFQANLLSPLEGNIVNLKKYQAKYKHYLAKCGMGSITKHLLSLATPNRLSYNHYVQEVSHKDNMIRVKARNGTIGDYNVILMTMPVPQMLKIQGIMDMIKFKSDLIYKLSLIKFSVRFSIVFYYDRTIKVNWVAKYIEDNPVFRYMSIDNMKCRISEVSTIIVLHTTSQFGEQYASNSSQEVGDMLVKYAFESFPMCQNPVYSKIHKWNYSQVLTPYTGTDLHAILTTSPMMIACGDSFTNSSLDGCVQSARSAVSVVNKYLC